MKQTLKTGFSIFVKICSIKTLLKDGLLASWLILGEDDVGLEDLHHVLRGDAAGPLDVVDLKDELALFVGRPVQEDGHGADELALGQEAALVGVKGGEHPLGDRLRHQPP